MLFKSSQTDAITNQICTFTHPGCCLLQRSLHPHVCTDPSVFFNPQKLFDSRLLRKCLTQPTTRFELPQQCWNGVLLTRQRPYCCLTDQVIFFYQVFDPVHQWPHHSLTDRGFFIFLESVSTSQWPYHGLSDWGYFKDILDRYINDHTTVSQTGSVVGALMS